MTYSKTVCCDGRHISHGAAALDLCALALLAVHPISAVASARLLSAAFPASILHPSPFAAPLWTARRRRGPRTSLRFPGRTADCAGRPWENRAARSEEHTSELQSPVHL